MLRAVSLALVACVCVATVSTAKAAYVPMLTKTSGGVETAMFADNFERATGLPDWPAATNPDVGSWGVNISSYDPHSYLVVTDESIAGVPAYEGSQYLKLDRPVDYNTSSIVAMGAVDSAAGDQITMKLAFRQVTGETSVYLQSGGTDLAQFGFGSWSEHTNAIALVDSTGNDWQWFNATYNADAWNTLAITHMNGTDAWSVSVNGSAPETLSGYAAGLTMNVNNIMLKNDVSGSLGYIDAVGVPEPSVVMLSVTGLLGLLAYAWRKRR